MQFYVLETEVGLPHETKFHPLAPDHIGEVDDCQKCPSCGRAVGMLPWLPPYRAELKAYGKGLGDVAFGPGNTLLVSARFRSAWETKNLRGLDFQPLERMRVRPARFGKKATAYYCVTPRRFGTRVNLDQSRIEYELPISCSQCNLAGLLKSIRGFAIDDKSWTGEDMFYAWGIAGSIIVSDRVRQLRDEHGLTNVNLVPTEKYFWDPYHLWSVSDYSRDVTPEPDDNADEHTTAMN